MDLDSRFELGAVAANDSESKTFRARETATGREVFVHILFGGKPPGGGESLLSVLSGRMTDPDPAKSAQVIEISDYKGMPFAVTPVVPGFQGLRAWLEQGRGAVARPATPAAEDPSRARTFRVPNLPVAASAPATPDDEFDRLFGTSPSAANPQPGASAAPPPPPPPASGRQAGEFTQLFRSTLGDIPVAPPPPQAPRAPAAASNPAPPLAARPVAPPAPPIKASPAPPAPRPEQPGPGDFTRMFQSEPLGDSSAMPAAMPPAPPAPPAQAGSAAGEFTRMFQASPAAGGASPVLPPQPEPAAAQPGGFTGLFGTPSSAEPRPAAPPAASYAMPAAAPPSNPQPLSGKSAGEFTQLFGRPGAAGSGGPAAPPPPARAQGATGVFSTPAAGPSPAPGRAAGPGEYTRVFGAQSSYAATGVAAPQAAAPQPPTAAPPAGAAPAAKAQMPLWPVVIGAAIVLLAAFGLLLYFLSKK